MLSPFINRILSAVTSVFGRRRTPVYVPVSSTSPSTADEVLVLDEVYESLPQLQESSAASTSSVAVLEGLLNGLSTPAPVALLERPGTLPAPRKALDDSTAVEGPLMEKFRSAIEAGEHLQITEVAAAEFTPVFINPNKSVIAGHGMVEKRSAEGVYTCRCGEVLGEPTTGRDAARKIMAAHREALRSA